MSPPARIRVRDARPSDIPIILELIAELARYERAPEAAVATPELLERHLFGAGIGRGPVAECWIGEIDGVAQGFALCFTNFSTWLGKPGLYLEDLFVRPEMRGHGLGKSLLVHCARVAKARGCGRFEWAVLDWNSPAIEFYRAHGARPMEEWTIWRVSDAAIDALAAERTPADE